MEHIITTKLLIVTICLLAYLTYLIHKKSKNFNDIMTIFEKKQAKNIELLADHKRRNEVLNEGKTKSKVKMTTQSTQGLPPPPPKKSNVYDKKFPSNSLPRVKNQPPPPVLPKHPLLNHNPDNKFKKALLFNLSDNTDKQAYQDLQNELNKQNINHKVSCIDKDRMIIEM